VLTDSFPSCPPSQVFNEYTARKIFDEVNMFSGLSGNYTFFFVSVFTIGMQIFLVEVAGLFMRTSPLTPVQWLITVALGAIGLPVGVLMRFFPAKEDPKCFFDTGIATSGVPGAPITAWSAEPPEKEKDKLAKEKDIESKG
jgi:Ca2+-transporting ATPase